MWISIASDEVDMFAVGDAMEERGWHLDRQPSPDSLHVMVTMTHSWRCTGDTNSEFQVFDFIMIVQFTICNAVRL